MPDVESHPPNNRPEWLEIVRRKVASLDFGVVQVVVHDGRVVQIECTEKTRLDAPRPRGRAAGIA